MPSSQGRTIFLPRQGWPSTRNPHPTLQCGQSQKRCLGWHTSPNHRRKKEEAPTPAPPHLQPAHSRLLTRGVMGTCLANADTIVISLVTARKGTKQGSHLRHARWTASPASSSTPQGTGQDDGHMPSKVGGTEGGCWLSITAGDKGGWPAWAWPLQSMNMGTFNHLNK